MKPIVLATLLAVSLGGSNVALAGGKGHGCGYSNCGGGYYPGYRPGGYYRPYYGSPQHKNNNNSNDSWAYALGGLVLGSVITNAYNNRAPQPQATYVETTTTYQPVQVQRVIVAQPRHLLRDLNGNCYERTTDAAGNELRTQLPPSDCNW
jgi:hypothetical protein